MRTAVVTCLPCAFAFNIMMQFGDPSFTPSTSQQGSVRQETSLKLAKSKNAPPSGYVTSNEINSRKVFDAVIINDAFLHFPPSAIKDVVDQDFTVPKEPIFNVDYTIKDDHDFAEAIVQHRVIPILQKAQVSSFDLLVFVSF